MATTAGDEMAGTFMAKSRHTGGHAKPQQAQYFVVRHRDQWKIKAGYRTTGAYPSKAHALCAAVDFAEKDGMAGRPAQVLMQDENGHFRTAWIYGQDPYPLRLRA
jgi:Uncharacterized protein conserved in bacteria (DUF2188)